MNVRSNGEKGTISLAQPEIGWRSSSLRLLVEGVPLEVAHLPVGPSDEDEGDERERQRGLLRDQACAFTEAAIAPDFPTSGID